jgi:hypothetical protein
MLSRTVVIAVAISVVLAIPGGAVAQVPGQDSVIGSGTANGFSFEIEARSGPAGESPTGFVSFESPEFLFFEGPVTCLSVDGNHARINVGTSQYGTVGLEVTDLPAGDLMRGIPVTSGTTCATPIGTAVDFNITSGDIVVSDAPRLPTSKGQCKNGGWRSYGVFKNQGDCVSFVATNDK